MQHDSQDDSQTESSQNQDDTFAQMIPISPLNDMHPLSVAAQASISGHHQQNIQAYNFHPQQHNDTKAQKSAFFIDIGAAEQSGTSSQEISPSQI